MQNEISGHFRRIPWKNILLLGMLLVLEFSIHPLTFGPDRKIHDPAVYRLDDPTYLSGDWYTNMAVESGVYTFYAKLVNVWHRLPLGEETWRMLLYLASLVVLYVSMIKVGRMFSKSFWVVPIVAACHALLMLVVPPIWLYGPFIQIDGGLAPRSIGMALSFLALFFLLKGARMLPWAILGMATLIHVSNSLIVFTLFFAAWLCVECEWRHILDKKQWVILAKKSFLALGAYLVSGGWFAAYVAHLGSGGFTELPTEKFIWSWIYFRAPYMALPIMPWSAWFLFSLHVLAVSVGWHILRKRVSVQNKKALDVLGFIGMGAIFYFFLFFFFAFVCPWLLGFEFYSIRVVYFTYFVAYLFTGLIVLDFFRKWILKGSLSGTRFMWRRGFFGGVIIVVTLFFSLSPQGKKFLDKAPKNIHASWTYLSDDKSRVLGVSGLATEKYLFAHPEPFLAPPLWYGSPKYLPNVASFKSFGFTKKGMVEWFDRMNDVSRGELERVYEKQTRSNRFEPVVLDWKKTYPRLTANEVISLSKKYHFKLFLTSGNLSYPFQLVAEDGEYRLYRILEKR